VSQDRILEAPVHTIVIAAPAVSAHLAHGDTMGECAPTTATPPAQHEQKPKKQRPEKQKPQKHSKAQKQAKQHGGAPRAPAEITETARTSRTTVRLPT